MSEFFFLRVGGGAGRVAARISEISYTKNTESVFFYKESKSNKKKSGGWEGRGWGVGLG